MAITRVLAHVTVSELAVSEPWYAALFGRGPDARPMDGLLEWHLGESFGLQVWSEPARAGNSTVVFEDSDLDEFAAHLDAVGIEHPAPRAATTVRILPLEDPDGNRVVATGTKS